MRFAGEYSIPIEQIRRYPFFNIGSADGSLRWLICLLSISVFILLVRSIIKRVKIWRQGKPQLRTDYPEKRLLLLVKYVIRQYRLLDVRYAGIAHSLMFYGFNMLFLVCLVIMFEQNITGPVFGNFFICGNFYLLLSFTADFAGFMLLIGLVLVIFKRYVSKPSTARASRTDTFAIFSLLFLVISGFLTEGSRIAVAGFPDFERWSFMGWASSLLFSGFNDNLLVYAQRGIWWLHIAAAFTFIAMLASGKLGHIIISGLNIYYANLSNENPETKYIMPPAAEAGSPMTVKDFTWKSLLDCDACTGCGRCEDNCPAWTTEKNMSPKEFILSLKNSMEDDPAKPLSFDSSALWACVNCAACMEVCPVLIEHIPKIIEIKRHKVLADNDIRYELRTMFENTAASGNPYGYGEDVLLPWLGRLKSLGVRNMAEDSADYLYFPGSSVYDDEDARQTALDFAGIMKKAGRPIGILNTADSGDAALRCGNESLFRTIAARNIDLFNRYGVKKIICASPHDYNVFKKEYTVFAENLVYDVEVFQHTQVILELLESGRIVFKEGLNEMMVYHDPCFLGRYNEIYDEPRRILSMIEGLNLIEMERNRAKSFCCGSSGGSMFLSSDGSVSMEGFRAKEAQFSGASMVCTACPFCGKNIRKGMDDMGIKNIKTVDIAGLVAGLLE
ncbi:MAG: heterodisulfide reductase-related iron-sulfur binding cluster [Leptospirales bacterium]|nr:heterodisulfide reductase-related iron-sulfur binding cluster [Leptospirales bacterium]